MPASLPTFDDEIELFFRESRHDLVLDIGPGEGKYGKLLRRVQPSARVVGVEIDPTYVEKYGLRELYDEVWVQDAADLMKYPAKSYSAVIFGDCIEHMRKSVGLDLLNFLAYRTRVIIVVFPLQMLQDDWEGHVHESHVAVWSENDFAPFDHIYVQRDAMSMCLVRGFLSRSIEWLPRPLIQRLGHPSMADYYNADPARWLLADIETRRRELSNADLKRMIPPDARFILVDECQSGLMSDAEDRIIPYICRDGQYWGLPADDGEAIAEVERQRECGAAFMVFAPPSMWAIAFYTGLMRHLRKEYRCALENERLVIYDLRRS